MRMNDFLIALDAALSPLAQEDRRSWQRYYSEMIQDRIEDGATEEQAVQAIGSPDAIASDILSQQPLRKIVRQRIKKEKGSGWSTAAVLLAIIGSPVWVPLICALLAVILTVYVVVWTVIACMYAAAVSLGVSAISGVILIVLAAGHNPMTSLAAAGAALILAGLTILAFLAAKCVSVGLVKLTGRMIKAIKRVIIGNRRKSGNEKVG